MTHSRLIVGALMALGATGCLATKGDIRLLQDEVQVARASAARADSAQRRTSDSLAVALASLASVQLRAMEDFQRRLNEEIKNLGARQGAFEVAAKEQLRGLTDDIDQVRELARQNSRGAVMARAQMEQAVPATPPDSAAATTATAPGATPPAAGTAGVPGPATLLVTGQSQIIQGSCGTARRSFEEITARYPKSLEAPEALWSIAESYVACGDGNPTRADSVYRLVTERYPTSDFSAVSLYKRAEMQRAAGRTDTARPLYVRVVCEYPRSTVYQLALDRLGSRPACR